MGSSFSFRFVDNTPNDEAIAKQIRLTERHPGQVLTNEREFCYNLAAPACKV